MLAEAILEFTWFDSYRLVLASWQLQAARWLTRHQALSQTVADWLSLAACFVAIIGVFATYNSWAMSRAINQQSAAAVRVANHSPVATTPQPLAQQSAPATTPTSDSLDSYQVATGLPRILSIPKLNIKARITSVGVGKDGSIGTPNNVFDTAWYNGSALPGQPGAALIDGHISSWTSQGVFYHLNNLHTGDMVSVELGGGQTVSYEVVRTQVYADDAVDMQQLLSSADDSRPGLNLISCYGSVTAGTNEFNQRLVVFTVER